MTLADAMRQDPWIAGALGFALMVALGVVGALAQLAVSYIRMYRNRWRTRRMVQQWYDADRRRRERLRGYAADGSDLVGDSLIDAIRVRYDSLPVKGRR